MSTIISTSSTKLGGRLLLASVAAVCLCTLPAGAADYYISVSGSDSGAGTIGDPWSITKLGDSSVGAPGDTIWMRGGTYVWADRTAHQNG